jgi:hypothetical protein
MRNTARLFVEQLRLQPTRFVLPQVLRAQCAVLCARTSAFRSIHATQSAISHHVAIPLSMMSLRPMRNSRLRLKLKETKTKMVWSTCLRR